MSSSDSSGGLNGLVSVVTPAYNSAAFIEQTIESVAKQTIKVHEHLIIDDGSSDDTAKIVESLLATYPSLRLYRQSNQGAGAARNVGIAQATGRYIAFLDSDDMWLPTKLEAQIGFMESEQVQFSFGDYDTVSESGTELLARFALPDRLVYADLLRGCLIGCLTAAFNQQAIGKLYMPDVRRGQDWGLWLAITRSGVVAQKYPGNLARYRSTAASLSSNKLRKIADVFSIYRRQEKLGNLRSGWYLVQHIANVLRKQRRYGQTFDC